MKWTRVWLLSFMVLLLVTMPACSTNPATGRAQLNMLSQQEEISMGEAAAPEFLAQFGGEIASQRIRDHVSRLGREMAVKSERPDLPWEFYTMDSQVVNAFALPGGKVFISRGLMEKMDNDAQLAALLGHEIGHVTAQHSGQQISRALLLQGLVIGASIGAGYAGVDAGTQMGVEMGSQIAATMTTLHFSRGQESEADDLGLRYMTAVGYNPIGMVQLMEILHKAGGGGASIEFLQTHPLPATRIRQTEQRILQRYPSYDDPSKWKMGFESFKVNVADELAKLPAAKHKQANAMHHVLPMMCDGCGGHDHAHDAFAYRGPVREGVE